MNREEYTRLALRTWSPDKIREKGEDPEEYLQTGLASELGELCGVRKRDMRDGYQPKIEWIKELGDCLWYAAVYCDQYSYLRGTSETVKKSLTEEIQERFSRRNVVKEAFDAGRFTGPFWVQVLFVQIMCHEFPQCSVDFVEAMIEGLGIDLDVVRQTNIDKLADRAERGVISGKGDHR